MSVSIKDLPAPPAVRAFGKGLGSCTLFKELCCDTSWCGWKSLCGIVTTQKHVMANWIDVFYRSQNWVLSTKSSPLIFEVPVSSQKRPYYYIQFTMKKERCSKAYSSAGTRTEPGSGVHTDSSVANWFNVFLMQSQKIQEKDPPNYNFLYLTLPYWVYKRSVSWK